MFNRKNKSLTTRLISGARWSVITTVFMLSLLLTVSVINLAQTAPVLAQDEEAVPDPAPEVPTVEYTNSAPQLPVTDESVLIVAGAPVAINQSRLLAIPLPSAPPITPSTRPTGTVIVNSGPYACPGSVGVIPGGTCYDIVVDCSAAITQTANKPAVIKVHESALTETLGTILLYSGFDGTYLWEEQTINAANVVTGLHHAGYRTVQVDWGTNWWRSDNYAEVGFGGQACNTAAIAEWAFEYAGIHDAPNNPETPYCASGHSNGASALAYTVAQYGLADRFSAVLFEAGPNWSRIDYSCIPGDPEYYLGDGGRRDIDRSFGFSYNGGKGYCYNNVPVDPVGQSLWEEASIVYNNWDFYYPQTMVSFVNGELDGTITRNQGDLYYDRLVQGATPHMISTTVTGAFHFVEASTVGGQVISQTLVSECIPAVATTPSASLNGADVVLDWAVNGANLAYELHFDDTPYFTPTATTFQATLSSSTSTFTDTGASAASMRFYNVQAVRGSTAVASSETGIFKFAIEPGS